MAIVYYLYWLFIRGSHVDGFQRFYNSFYASNLDRFGNAKKHELQLNTLGIAAALITRWFIAFAFEHTRKHFERERVIVISPIVVDRIASVISIWMNEHFINKE